MKKLAQVLGNLVVEHFLALDAFLWFALGYTQTENKPESTNVFA